MTSPSSSDNLSSPEAIARSGRWSFLSLFCGAAFWLAVAGILGLIAAVKVHAPTLLADCAWFSYGRLKAAAGGAFNFGFATQAAVAVALWLVALLGRTGVRLPFVSFVACKLWNLGVFLGVFGVMYGDGSGHPLLEFPRYSMGVLLFAYLGLAIPVFVTFHNRTVRELYPSIWFVVGGLFWFAWLFSTAVFLLHVAPVRGILQAAVQGWFANGFVTVWLFPIAIAVLIYLRPAMSGMAMPSRATILLGFWGLAFLGPWGGIAVGTPLPAWVGAVSTSISTLLIIPILAVFQSVGGMKPQPTTNPFDAISWKLADYSFLALVLFGVLNTVNTFAPVYHLTEFTLITLSLQTLAIYGVAGTAFFAAAYQILPRVVAASAVCPQFARLHSVLVRAGVGIFVLSMLVGGFVQGRALMHPDAPFANATAEAKMWFRLSTLGDLLLAVAGVIFVGYVSAAILRAAKAEYVACPWCGPAAKPVEVAS